MKPLSQTAYRALFFKHVYRFLGNVASPGEIMGPHAIAVSGGLDSMALLWLGHSLYKLGKMGEVRALFVHHHTRPGQDEDAQLVQEFCDTHGISFEVLDATGLSEVSGNFEERARGIRRSLLLGALRKRESLWLGHHLDDSYEWSMMQKHRSNQATSSLGIPVRNGVIMRPFLCVTRGQLQHLAKLESIPFREDPTNRDTHFDRNYLRMEVIPKIRARYPKFLKHYAYSSNHLAMIMNLNITNRVVDNQIYVYDNGALVEGLHYNQFEIQELLHTYSTSNRGEITSQILKMLKAIDNQKKGPFQFSGGTQVYHSHHLLMITAQKMVNNDRAIARVLATLSDEELRDLPSYTWMDLNRAWKNLLNSSDAMLNMPGLVLIVENISLCKTLNTSVYDSLFPSVSDAVAERKLCFISSLKCLDVWKKKKNKLPEKIRLLPLWTLSNLFAFQE